MSLERGTVIVTPKAYQWVKSGVDASTLTEFARENYIAPNTIKSILAGLGVRISTAFRVESMVPKEKSEMSDQEALERLRAEVVELRALLAPILAERAAELAAKEAA